MATTSSSPDPEVPAKAVRRRFTAAEKARILVAYEAASSNRTSGDLSPGTDLFVATIELAKAASCRSAARGEARSKT